MNSSRMYVSRSLPATVTQFEALVGMLESEPDIARGLKISPTDRIKAQKFWEKVAPILNDFGGGFKTRNQWMKFWTDKKAHIKKKATERSSGRQRFGWGLEEVSWLNNTEERVLQILGSECCAVGDSHHQYPVNQVVNDADPSVSEEDDDGDYSGTLVESNVVNDADPSVSEEEDDGDDSGTLVESNVVNDADPSVGEEDDDGDDSGTLVESNVVNDADPSVSEEDDDDDDSGTLVESNVVNDADPFVSEEDDDGDDSGTLVKSNMCRVCLALDVKMYDLRKNELKIMFQNITGIMFNENNYSVLGSLCWECAARLKAAATFRSKALLSDSLLQDLVPSGEQIRKNDITALKENALSQGLISAKTLTVIDVFHIVDIEDQNNTTQLLQSGDDGDQTSISENIDTEKYIIEEIKDENSEMDVEDYENVAIKTEIEGDITSPNTEEENRTNIKEKTPVDITSSGEDTIKSAYCSLLVDMGLTDERNLQENCENDINKTVVRKIIIKGIKEENSEMEIEDDNNVAIKTEIGDDPTFPNYEERNTEGENPLISSSSQDKIGSTYSSLLLDIGQCLLRSDILRSPQEESDTDKTVINTISKSDLISRTGPQHITEPINNNPIKRTIHCTSHDHTYFLKPDTLDIKRRNRKKRFVINKDSKQKVEKKT